MLRTYANTRVLLTSVIFILAACHARSQNTDRTQLISGLRYVSYCLADDSMRGRLAGSSCELKAAKVISSRFRKMHLKPVTGKDYAVAFTFPGDSGKLLSSADVTGRTGNKKGKVILIGAHYDHIGMGGKLSRSLLKTEVHNGADDNASGVAVMLELARAVSKQKKLKFSYTFVAFSAHEEGLYGSRFMVQKNLADTNMMALMINIDMVGRLDSATGRLFYSTNRKWCDSLLLKTQPEGLMLNDKELPPGDHSSFDSADIPVIYLTTGMHDDYHKVTDDADLLNYKGMAQITEFLITFLRDLEKKGIKDRAAQ